MNTVKVSAYILVLPPVMLPQSIDRKRLGKMQRLAALISEGLQRSSIEIPFELALCDRPIDEFEIGQPMRLHIGYNAPLVRSKWKADTLPIK